MASPNVFRTEPEHLKGKIVEKAKDQVHRILDVYQQAALIAKENGEELNLEQIHNYPEKNDVYKQFAEKIDAIVKDEWHYYNTYVKGVNGAVYDPEHPKYTKLPDTFSEHIDNFVDLKIAVSTLLLKLIAKGLIEKDYLKREYLEKILQNNNNFITYLLWLVENEPNMFNQSHNASAQSAGKNKKSKEKIRLKENAKEYVVHLTDKKAKFITRKGDTVLLSDIRGKYNYVR